MGRERSRDYHPGGGEEGEGMPVQTNKNSLENMDLAHVNQYSRPAPPIEQRGRQGDEEDEHGADRERRRGAVSGGLSSAEGGQSHSELIPGRS